MDIETTILRRVAAVNLGKLSVYSVESVHEGDSGGIHIMLRSTGKSRSAIEQVFIPLLLKEDLVKNKRNRVLDNKFRL